METNFWDNGIELISLIKDTWKEPTSLKLENLRKKINEEIKKPLKRTYEAELIIRIQYTHEKLRFTSEKESYNDFITTFLYNFFPQKLIKFNNGYVELLKNPEIWISSSEVNK